MLGFGAAVDLAYGSEEISAYLSPKPVGVRGLGEAGIEDGRQLLAPGQEPVGRWNVIG